MDPLSISMRFLPQILGAAAVLGGVWYIDHLGYERAQRDQQALEQRLGEKITTSINGIDTRLNDRLSKIDTTQHTVVQPAIIREIARDPRYSSAACSLTDGMWTAIGRARAASGSSGATDGTLPTAPATGR